jgi:FAD synthase
LRDEQKFASIDELKRQLERDRTRASQYFERSGVRRTLAIV